MIRRSSQAKSLTRATVRQINSINIAPYLDTARTGLGKVLPVIYGVVRTAGLFLTRRVVDADGNLVFAVAWSHGPIHGVKEVFINAAPIVGGVTITHYNGDPGQPVDPTLAAAIPGFIDSFPGVAYSVFVVSPDAAIDGLPRVEAVVRGRVLLDPRTGLTGFTENPALFVYDFVTNKSYGAGIPCEGIRAVADRCDSLYLGEPRCRAGLMIATADTLERILPVLCTYAECLWCYEDDGVTLVPDAAVSEPVAVLTEDDIVEGTFVPDANGAGSTPTVMAVTYLPRSEGPASWVQTTSTVILPEVIIGTVPDVESPISLLGVYREIEAYRKGVNRLNRLRMPGTFRWEAFDSGVKFVKGDVVQLPDMWGLTEQWVRITDVQIVEPGRYSILAEIYSDSAYSDEVVSDYPDSPIYDGLILPYTGDLPDGWVDYTAANGYFIRGADGDSIMPGDIQGSATAGPWSGETTENELHEEGRGPNFIGPGVGVPLSPYNALFGYEDKEVWHKHTVTIPEFTPNVYRRAVKLMKKSGDGEFLPINSMIFGESGIVAFGLNQILEHNQRILMADSETYSEGVANQVLSGAATISAHTGSHSHNKADGQSVNYIGPSNSGYDLKDSGSENHVHPLSTTLNIDLKRTTLCMYGPSYPNLRIKRGMCALWDGDLADIPPDWVVDEDFVDRLIEINATSGLQFGSNKITAKGKVGRASHTHRGGSRNQAVYMGGLAHGPTFHDHDIDVEIDWTPPSFALIVIKYLPEAHS